ncbi:MAG: GatB/YqeY domain-containing protein [Clostridia bacterium]|nr:GatB/YqeY domain-containing protein [Clostridia bacterium]MDE7215980.1 GatB/YqeY domain-containing protein [Clostridia bacterium]
MDIDFFKKEKVVKMKEKDKDGVSALNVIINKIMLASIEKRAKGESLSEGDILSLLQKTEKELIEEKSGYEKAGANYLDKVQSLDNQIKTIKSYLPSLMSKEEIQEVILSLDDKSVPNVMRHFKTNFNGKCDMKVVNEVLRSLV